MRSKFSGPASHVVTLKHGGEEMSLTLTALPLGYSAYIERIYPQPVEVVNGERRPLASAAYDWRFDVNLFNIAKALGDQIEAQAPTSSDVAAWAAYGKALRAELTAAGLNDHDYTLLANGLAECHRGTGEPGKA